MRILRVYHAGADHGHRARERALVRRGVDMTLVIPTEWPDAQSHPASADPGLTIYELPITRQGNVNQHAYRKSTDIARLIHEVAPDVLDIHEEPFSVAAHQWRSAASISLPIVMYTAQNIDKRYPPPFAQYERASYRRITGLYPCSSQAASVARGKGFAGAIQVVPLGYDEQLFFPGSQELDDHELILALFGRLVPEKGVVDAVRVLARLRKLRPARLVVTGSGPDEVTANVVADSLGVRPWVEFRPWGSAHEVAATCRSAHVVLVPSTATNAWAEQFGRVIVEAQASGAIIAGYASGAIPEVAGAAGILSRPGQALDLADELVALLGDRDRYAALRKEGIASAGRRTWTQIAEQQEHLYQAAVHGNSAPTLLQGSPRQRRTVARTEFGSPASTPAGSRPLAIPWLRRGGLVARALCAVLDGVSELAAAIAIAARRGAATK